MAELTLEALTVTDYQGNATDFAVRTYANADWKDADNIQHVGGALGSRNFFQSDDCTRVGSTIQIPAITLPCTVDALVNPNVKITSVLYGNNKPLLVLLELGSIPTDYGLSMTWEVLRIYNRGRIAPPYIPGHLNANETLELIRNVLDGEGGGSGASALDELSDVAAPTPGVNDFLQFVGGAWRNRTPAQAKDDFGFVKADIGLGNVDNTSDADKPVSTAQAAALAAKQATLVNQENIKSINGISLIGAGDLNISGGSGGAGLVKYLSDYADFQTGITEIGATPATLVVDSDTELTEYHEIQATLKLRQANGAQISFSGAGSIRFLGEGLEDALEPRSLFLIPSLIAPIGLRDYTMDDTTDIINLDGQTITTGMLCRYEHTADTIFGGLTDGAYYWLISVDATHVRLATSYANALAGIYVDITSEGTSDSAGTLTIFNLVWSGATAPAQISSETVDTNNDSETDRLKVLIRAYLGKAVTFHVHPRTITSAVEADDHQNIYFLPGEHQNTFYGGDEGNQYKIPFEMGSYSKFYADGWGTIVYETNQGINGNTTAIVTTRDGATSVGIENIHFKHNPGAVFNSSATTASLKNCSKSWIKNCWFDACRAYHAGVIVVGYDLATRTNNYEAYENEIWNNLCTGYMTQNLFIIGGHHNSIRFNRIMLKDAITNAYSSLIDIEPNTQFDKVHDCDISYNEIDARDVVNENNPSQQINYLGMIIQSIYTDGIRNINVVGNKLLSYDEDSTLANYCSGAIQFDGGYNITVEQNEIYAAAMYFTQGRKLYIRNNRGQAGTIIKSCAETLVSDNQFKENYPTTESGVYSGTFVEQAEVTKPFSSDGTTVTLLQSMAVHPQGDAYQYFVGLKFLWNNIEYTIDSVSDNVTGSLAYRSMETTPDVPATGIVSVDETAFDVAASTVTAPSPHGFETGALVSLYHTANPYFSVVPTYTSYYVIKVSSTVYKLAETRALAVAGTAKAFTYTGGYVLTANPTPGETIDFNGVTFTFVSGAPASATETQIGTGGDLNTQLNNTTYNLAGRLAAHPTLGSQGTYTYELGKIQVNTSDSGFAFATDTATIQRTGATVSTGQGDFEFHPALELRFQNVLYANNHANNGERRGDASQYGYDLDPDGNSQILSTYTDKRVTSVGDASRNVTHNDGILLYATPLTADRTASLPPARDICGKEYYFKDMGAVGTYVVTIVPDGTDEIEGESSFVLDTEYASVRLKSVVVSTANNIKTHGWIVLD